MWGRLALAGAQGVVAIAEALPYIDIEEEKYIRGKLTEKKWLDNYEIYKDEDGDGDGKGEGDKCSFVWRCKVNCQAKRKVKAQEGSGKLGASEDI